MYHEMRKIKMKKVFTFLTVVLFSTGVFAQSPEKMSYQSVVRNTNNELVSSTTVGLQISIVQGSASGTIVYTETHTPETNSNGLVSIEIGTGTVVDGSFTSIDWSNGPYFIKTETDPSGGTDYSISGTSQLLSVPYALHAKTAENVSGAIEEADPVFTDSEAANITSTDITKLNNLSGTNTGDQDLSELALKTALSDSIAKIRNELADSIALLRNEIPDVKKYSVGDFAHGGVVFWVDETGQHGLVAAKEDIGSIQWYNGTNTDTEANGSGVYSGEMNTLLIVADQGSNSKTYAAGLCAEYNVLEDGVTYGDWYLPSKAELDLLYQNKEIIDTKATENGGSSFTSDYYWSSTEVANNNNYAEVQDFSNGEQSIYFKNSDYNVRAIRAF